MIKIYHNPRCSKSRQGLALIQESSEDFEIVDYMKVPLTKKDLEKIVKNLDIKPIDLVRKNETIWKENFKGQTLTDDEIVEAMVSNPKLIERPIVIKDEKAVIGRPPENIKNLLSN